MQTIKIYTDGGARGNPGPAGIGAIFMNVDGAIIKKYSEFIGKSTNNQAEYRAVIFALKKVKVLFGKQKTKQLGLEFYLDSELVVKQMRGEYRIKEKDLQPLFCDVWNLKIDFGAVEFFSIAREQNKEADKLVNEAIDGEISKNDLGI
ncbi:MAG: hypothetical protein COS76_03860 [Candidatus Portnoybacteria bacterium CG06_land_8_20_14_3_00_39_12]|uniref:RNase H type-1 domain-containing protein n=1 Tax=Candidatus Portnoybacteria bacterium CG06_land_8_20_14_3_00_39_12 TaxID=1974809 RepID=A0A2M7AW64_9BACT|nr:MAG: hypothetical protein AUJ33_03215 [Parcubacteria group bacterium CG1_02_40_25]PIU74870.1 MAG: hypothetical protein COS76_03860 [Candidatus Portnoybacteria bacterium CG06_land_8_20_14_3_00_39_12]